MLYRPNFNNTKTEIMEQNIQVLSYTLPDISILHDYKPDKHFYLWQPDQTIIVLGRSNKAKAAINHIQVLEDNVPVYQRPSGGESVLLSPKTLVISAVGSFNEHKKPTDFFAYCNGIIIEALEQMEVSGLGQNGISDITLGAKKILGSSMYKHSERWFYHSVLNLGIEAHTIARYLQHPSREPDYRKGRSHEAFVTSLGSEGYHIDIDLLKKKIAQGFLY